MTDKKNDSSRLLWMLGAAMTLPAILVSGPIAGYLIGHYILFRYFKLPGSVVPLFVGLGFVGSALQIYQLIKKIKRFESPNT